MRRLQAAILAGALAAVSTACLAQEEVPPRFTDDQLTYMCKAKRGTVAYCECMLKTYKTVLPTDEVNLLFWTMYDNSARAKAYARARGKADRQWAKDFGRRAGLVISSLHKNCDDVF